MDVDSKYVIIFYTLITLFADSINYHHGIIKIQLFSPKLMLTRYTSVICILYITLLDNN